MRYLFFVISFFLVFKTSKEYLPQQLIINRPSFPSDGNSTMVDGFRNVLASGSNVDCSEFNALVPDGMPFDRCICRNDAATFSFFNGKWQCVNNEDFREREGCGSLFPLESDDSPLGILAERDEVVIKLPSQNCSLTSSSCMYLDCERWRPIDKIIVMEKFSLNHWTMDYHILKVLSGNFSSFLNGRVIKLSLTCLPLDDAPCLIFKIKGSITCPFQQDNSDTTITTSSPSTVLQINSSTSLKELVIKPTIRSYKQTESETLSSLARVVQTTSSFKPIRMLYLSTTLLAQGSFASTTSYPQSKTPTGNNAVSLRTLHELTTPVVQGTFTVSSEKISFAVFTTPYPQSHGQTGNVDVPIGTLHVSTTPVAQGTYSTISGEKISFALSTTPFPQSKTLTGNVALPYSHESVVVSEFSILQSRGKQTQLMPHQLATPRSDQHSSNTVMFNGLESTGVNLTLGSNQSTLLEKMSTTRPPVDNAMEMLLKTVLPGTVVGIFVVSVSLLLLCIARRMGNMMRVGTDRNAAAAQGEVQSISEDATVNGSVENISVYELVERGNSTDLPELGQAVKNQAYQKEVNIVVQDVSHASTQPNGKEVIYAEPFAPLPGRSDNDTRLTSLKGSAGSTSATTTSNIYQSLLGKSAESVLYASRYSVPKSFGQGPSHKCTEQVIPKGPSMRQDSLCTRENLPNTERYSWSQQSESVPFVNGLKRATLSGASTSHHSSSNMDDLPNMERKDRYKLKDILVEELEIETSGTNDLFEKMCIPPSVLVSDTAETGNKNCENIQPGHVKAVKERFNSMSGSSQGARPERRNKESLKNAQCLNDAASSENKLSPKEKLIAFFKMTL